MMTTEQRSSKALNTSLWVAQILLSLLMLMGAGMKFMPIEKLSAMMPWTGQVSSSIIRLLGLVDLLGAVGLLLPGLLNIRPQLTGWAAMGIILLMISAIIFHVSRGETPVIGINIISAIIAAFIAWGRFKK